MSSYDVKILLGKLRISSYILFYKYSCLSFNSNIKFFLFKCIIYANLVLRIQYIVDR